MTRRACWLLVSTIGAVACGKPVAPVAPAEPGYVGVAACVPCHRQQVEAWRGSHHDLAMQPATGETVLGDFDGASVAAHGVGSTFFTEDGQYRVRTDGPDGAPATFRVAYTFGVTPLQQYLIEMPGGRYQALGLAWDARPAGEGGQRWFHLYPADARDHREPLHWTGPQQNWNYMCAECHSTALARNYAPAEDRFDTTWSEVDVSCEACHGPASLHVDWVERDAAARGRDAGRGLVAGLRSTDGGRWVFDGARPTARRSVPRSSDAELETCARCHSRRGWVWEDYLPGRPLADTHRVALLEQGLYQPDGQILDEVYEYGSFLQSRMHAEGVTCSDCHDPHSARLVLDGNALCSTCHAPATFDTPEHHHHAQGRAGTRCVDCHMPERKFMIIDPRRDHGFRVPRPDLSVALGVSNACNDCHAERSPRWAATTVAGWFPEGRSGRFHYGTALHAARIGHPDGPALLRRVVGDPAQPAIVRATALAEMWRAPVRDLAAVLGRAAADADPLVRRVVAELAGEIDPDAGAALAAGLLDDPVRTVRLAAAASLAGTAADRLDADRRLALDRAIAEYRESLEFDRFRAEAQLNLGNLERQLGHAAEAEAAYRRAHAADPSFAPAQINLADLLASLGRNTEGVSLLREAASEWPDSAELHHALGLALARERRNAEALEHLRRAASLLPGSPRFAFVYGVALHDTGDLAGALEVLRAAAELHPHDREIRRALEIYDAERGR
ncbi:MAG TPA: tetratricopeptide repeat protein [Candidatus Polarisedimenticolaceae bacterium]|nr:tetratricopeptide repeat protein [Candidatus Polarisedimenticolaceae bacterium]